MPKHSNTAIEYSTVLENMDKDIFVPFVLNGDNEKLLLKDNTLHGFVNEDGEYLSFINEVKKYYNSEIVLKKVHMTDLMTEILSERYKGIFFHDILKTQNFFSSAFISYQDISKYRDIIDINRYLRDKQSDILNEEELIENCAEKHFFALLAKGNTTSQLIAIKEENNEEYYTLLFTTQTLAREFQTEHQINADIIFGTLRNIVSNTLNKNGVAININSSLCSIISSNTVHDVISRTTVYKDKKTIVKRIAEYAMCKEYFVILNSVADYDDGNGYCLKSNIYNNKKVVSAITIFEKYEDACAYVDTNFIENIEDIRPIGKINSEALKKILNRAKTVGVNNICFDADTERQIVVDLETAYQIIFNNNDFISINKPIRIPIYDYIPPKGLPSKTKNEICKNHKYYSEIISNGNIEETLCYFAYYNQLYREKSEKEYENKEKDLEKLHLIKKKIFKNLLLKLNEERTLYLILQANKKQALLSSDGAPYIQIKSRYVANYNNTLKIEMCDKTISSLQSLSNHVVFTNNNNIGTIVDIEFLKECYKEIEDEEINRAKILIYLIYKCGLSIESAEKLYLEIYNSNELYSKFLSLTSLNSKKEND